MIGSLAAVLVFLALLLFSSQVLVALYARSVVNAAGFDAARQVASRDVDHGDPVAVSRAQHRAEARLRSLLGSIGEDADLAWQLDADSVSLRVRVDLPRIGHLVLTRPPDLMQIDRTYVVRLEHLR